MNRIMLNGAATAAVAAGIAAFSAGAAQADEARCGTAASQLAIGGAMHAAADPEVEHAMVEAAGGLPAYCEITATLHPVEGSDIGVVYRLPEEWNGRVLGIGGGGWMGNVTLQAASEGLSRGYATMQTDGGHANGTGFDATPWAVKEDGSYDRVKIQDFSYRAIHEMTEKGKMVAEAYYAEPHEQAMYLGCSTGGRQGLMEVQRYPDDYDGVIAGAPVYSFLTQTTQTLRSVAFDQPGARLMPEHLTLIQESSLAACDAADGAEDGVLRDPRQCDWDPAELLCEEGDSAAACLTQTQVDTMRRVYTGETMQNGEIASYPLSRGGEQSWLFFVPASAEGEPGGNSGGLYAFRGEVLGDPEFDMSGFDAEDVATVRGSWMAEAYEAADTDIADFVEGGGKLLLWHGFNDPGPSALATVDYYEEVQDNLGDDLDSVRLFLAPGVDHCRGGAGPDTFDLLGAMDTWITDGEPPEQMLATKADSDLEWNLCVYPQLPTGQPDGTYRCE